MNKCITVITEQLVHIIAFLIKTLVQGLLTATHHIAMYYVILLHMQTFNLLHMHQIGMDRQLLRMTDGIQQMVQRMYQVRAVAKA
jgi:hypothetical protein